MAKKILLIGFLFITIALIFFLKAETDNGIFKIPIAKNILVLTSTPIPFEELTIPYLRKKEYKSNLGKFEKYDENYSYTSYLTSYTSDGLKINGLLTQPTGKMPKGGWPAIVFVHGYIPPKSYKTTGNYIAFVDYLAKNGFVVFKIDLRGHDQSEGDAGGAYYSVDYIVDILNARSALKNSDFVGKIGLWGHSMAGNVLLKSFAVQPNIPAIVIWAGAVYTYADRIEFGIQDGSYLPAQVNTQTQKYRQRLRDTHGEFDPKNPFWQQFPATNYLQDLRGVIQLNHAVDDAVVDIGYSKNLNKLLDKTSVVHELNEYPSGGHNFTGATFIQAMEKTTNFFKKYLK